MDKIDVTVRIKTKVPKKCCKYYFFQKQEKTCEHYKTIDVYPVCKLFNELLDGELDKGVFTVNPCKECIDARKKWKSKNKSEEQTMRYYVDLRIGCVAVRDSMVEEDTPGLYDDLAGVVKYWQGERTDGINGVEWNVPDEIKREAEEFCKQLNESESKDESND